MASTPPATPPIGQRERSWRSTSSRFANVVDEICNSEGRPLQALANPINVVSADAFEVDRKIDVEDSEVHLIYLQISFENILLKEPEECRPKLQPRADAPFGSNVIRGLQARLDKARDGLKGGASLRLLRCIQKVIASGKTARQQAMLQALVLNYKKFSHNEGLILPQGMSTPRSAIHSRDRMRHFRRIKKEGELHQYLHMSELLPQKALIGMTAASAASSPPSSPNRSQLCTPMTLQLTGTLGASFSAPSLGTPAGGRAMSPLAAVGSLTDWYSEQPHTAPQQKRTTTYRKHRGKGITAQLAKNARIGRDGHVVQTQSVYVNASKSETDMTVLDADTAEEVDIELLKGPAEFLARRYHKRYGREEAVERRELKYADTLDQDMAMPRLMGVTSGFAEKDPAPACPWLKSPPKGGWPKAERYLADGLPTKEPELERPLSKSSSAPVLPPVGECCSLSRSGSKNIIAPGGLKPRHSMLPLAKVTGRLSTMQKKAKEEMNTTDQSSGGQVDRRKTLSHAKMRLSGMNLGRAAGALVDWRALYDSQLSRSTQLFLEESGLEKKGLPSSKMSKDISLLLAGQHQKGWRETVNNMALSKSQPPSLPKRNCLPMDSSAALDLEQDRLSPLDRSCTPEVGYYRGCMHEKINPRLVKFLAVPTAKLDLQSMLLGDGDLEAVLEALQAPNRSSASREDGRVPVTHINLSNNKRLTDLAVSQFLSDAMRGSRLLGAPCVGQTRFLSLAYCSNLGEQTCDVLATMLGQGTELIALSELDLSGIVIPVRSWQPLTEGMCCRRSLRRLHLAQTECGRQSQHSCLAVASLIDGGACRQLEFIDISGNHFLHEGCKAIGRALRNATDTMQEIDLSHNAGFASVPKVSEQDAGEGGLLGMDPSRAVSFNPIMHVLEVLGETTVTRVAFANCQLQYAEDCILEDVVQSSDITHLDVADNPHGEAGLRCLVRLLVRGRDGASQLEYLNLQTVRNHMMPSDTLTYDYVDPSAIYTLSLENPQHRSVLRMLLKRGEGSTKGRGEEFTCFENETMDGRRTSLKDLCSKRLDRGGDDWQVPERGTLCFTFKQPLFYKPQDCITDVFVKFAKGQKVIVNFSGFSRLMRLYSTLPDERSQLMLLSAMSHDLVFKLCQVRHFARTSPDIFLFIVMTLLPSVEERTSRMVLFDLVDSCRGRGTAQMVRQVRNETRSLLYFNAQHADGHYTLNLSNKVDRGTAQRCIVISNWVKNKSIAMSLLDLSEYGNQECLRHTQMGKTYFLFDSDVWQLPEDGLFSFDLVLPRIRLDESNTVAPAMLEVLSQALVESPCNFRDRLYALRLVAHSLTLRPDQLRKIIEIFPLWNPKYGRSSRNTDVQYDFRPRAEAYILLYNRTIYHSMVVSPQILYNYEILHREEVKEIQVRQGYIHTFDVINAHDKKSNLGNKHGPLDMNTYDGWIIVKILLCISGSERSPNFELTQWSEKASLAERGYVFIIPATWVPDPPRSGEFTTTFHSQNDEVNYTKRKELAKSMLGWTFPSTEKMKRLSGLTSLLAFQNRPQADVQETDMPRQSSGDSDASSDTDADDG